jgi:hypothetical protein
MAVAGAIAERVKGILPVTWDALSQDGRYGDGLLRTTIDTAKEKVLGTNVAPGAEGALPLLVIDYVAKVATIELILPGIDFWMNQSISESATGTNENTTYENRAERLMALRKDLIAETRLMWADVSGLISFRRTRRGAVPLMNTIEDPLLTPSPQEFPRPYRATERS